MTLQRVSFAGPGGELAELGITAIALMPVAEFPGVRGWGYDGVYTSAPHSGSGGPDGLAQLVDAAHAEGLAVVLDVVYNHLGASGVKAMEAFGHYFERRSVRDSLKRVAVGFARRANGQQNSDDRRNAQDDSHQRQPGPARPAEHLPQGELPQR